MSDGTIPTHYIQVVYNDGERETFGVGDGELRGEWEDSLWLTIAVVNGNVFKIALREVRKVWVHPNAAVTL